MSSFNRLFSSRIALLALAAGLYAGTSMGAASPASVAPPPPPPPPTSSSATSSSPVVAPPSMTSASSSDPLAVPTPSLEPAPAPAPAPVLSPVMPSETGSARSSLDAPAATPGRSFAGGLNGTVNATKLNIRCGPSTDTFEIVSMVGMGEKVIVLAQSEGWYQIAYPASVQVYIKESAVEGKIPEPLPAEGVRLPVGGSGAQLHVRNWEKSTVVGEAKAGEAVTVVGRRGEFLKIQPPEGARAWVASKYVKLDDDGKSLPSANLPTPGEGAKPAEAKPAKAAKDEVAVEQPRPVVRQPVQTEDDMVSKIEQDHNRYMSDVDRELSIIRADAERRKREIAANPDQYILDIKARQARASGLTTGWVEYIGYGLQRPAAYRLVSGGQTMFLMRSATINLQQYIGQRVAVDGMVEKAPGFEANVLVVDRIDTVDTGISGEPNPPVKEDNSFREGY